MPILTLTLPADVSRHDAAALVCDLIALSTQALHKRADVTSVVLQRIAPGDWWVGGAAATQPCAQLDIRITQGTNSETEKADFVARAFLLLHTQLASNDNLHSASYVTVQEVPATDWGYGGKTQAQRRHSA